MLANIARITIARRAPRAFAPMVARGYSENQFNRKEKAHEDQFARNHEREQLAKLREEIKKKQEELAALEAKTGEKSQTPKK